MKRIAIIFATISVLMLSSCEKEPKANFENRDYYKGDDLVLHEHDSPCLDYFILEFKNGEVEFSEAYHNPSSPHKWTKKDFTIFGDTGNNAHFPLKNKGTYERVGDEIIFHGLNATNYIDEYIEFTKAEIRGEKAGTVNIDVYYTTNMVSREKSGKINFIGCKY